ncbi:MAG TPA: hypothetical protein VNN62_01945 [Methylomirabilota bacterium]|nr:hypothetical protein [Methylomirabilota bacterium]HZT35103.1 hypothetical protein [Nitrososphaera sp.]
MLKIRQEQLDVFGTHARRQFEEQMVTHVKQFFREQCDRLGYSKVREVVRYGIQRAEDYGITNRSAICKYLNLMFAFGQDFDKDSRFPWARSILESQMGAVEKVEHLYATAMTKLAQACGINGGALR